MMLLYLLFTWLVIFAIVWNIERILTAIVMSIVHALYWVRGVFSRCE